MDIPFFCSGAALVFLEPGLHGGWAWLAGVVIVAIILLLGGWAWLAGVAIVVIVAIVLLLGGWAWLAGVVIVAITLSAVAAFWISPVACAFSLHEKEAPDTTSWLLIAGSVLACLGLLVGLTFTVFPIGCATHAQLVSAYVPPDVTDWDVEANKFAEKVQKEAKEKNQMIRDLAPVRDRVLDQLAASRSDDTTQIAKFVSKELADFLLHGRGDLDSSAPPRRETRLDPRLIETVELAVLMGWNALYSGPRQRLSYLVSNRAERFEWKWQRVAETRFPADIDDEPNPVLNNDKPKSVLNIRTIRAGGNVPQLVRVITANLSEDKTKLTVQALVAVHDGGDIELKLKEDDSPTDLVSTKIHVPGNNAAFYVESIYFQGSDLSRAKKLVQPGTDNEVVRNDNEVVRNDNEVVRNDNEVVRNDNEVVRNLPLLLPSQPKLYLSGPEGNKLRDTIDYLTGQNPVDYLTGQNPVCTNAPDDIRDRLAAWRSSFGFSDFLAPKLVDSIGCSDAVLHMRNDGVILLVPTRTIPDHKCDPPSPVNLPQLEWLFWNCRSINSL